jgi:phosphocarrier protein HPr
VEQDVRRSGSEMDEARASYEVVNALGLHARAATKLVQLAARYPCEIEIGREGQRANAKSVMGVLLLCGAKGAVLEVWAKGERASDAVEAIGHLIASRFGEAE